MMQPLDMLGLYDIRQLAGQHLRVQTPVWCVKACLRGSWHWLVSLSLEATVIEVYDFHFSS